MLNITDRKGLSALRSGKTDSLSRSPQRTKGPVLAGPAASGPAGARGQYLGARVGHIQVMQGDVLDDLLLLVHIPLGQGNVLFGFKVKFCGIRVTPALPLQRQREA